MDFVIALLTSVAFESTIGTNAWTLIQRMDLHSFIQQKVEVMRESDQQP
jgi:hypothetical protein